MQFIGPDAEPLSGESYVRLQPCGTKAKGFPWQAGTAEAIAWLEARARPGLTVCDVGTGTGILALVAATLGATVTAYEIHDSVREVAKANFRLNFDEWPFEWELREEYDGAQGFDLVVANLGDKGDYSLINNAGREVWTSG